MTETAILALQSPLDLAALHEAVPSEYKASIQQKTVGELLWVTDSDDSFILQVSVDPEDDEEAMNDIASDLSKGEEPTPPGFLEALEARELKFGLVAYDPERIADVARVVGSFAEHELTRYVDFADYFELAADFAEQQN